MLHLAVDSAAFTGKSSEGAGEASEFGEPSNGTAERNIRGIPGSVGRQINMAGGDGAKVGHGGGSKHVSDGTWCCHSLGVNRGKRVAEGSPEYQGYIPMYCIPRLWVHGPAMAASLKSKPEDAVCRHCRAQRSSR